MLRTGWPASMVEVGGGRRRTTARRSRPGRSATVPEEALTTMQGDPTLVAVKAIGLRRSIHQLAGHPESARRMFTE